MKLESMNLENFQGIRSFKFEPKGRNTIVRGTNGSGKTTLFSAFMWCLFGKDSQGRSDFAIKTLDTTGQAESNIDHSVEVVLSEGDRSWTLKKVLKEKWTKKRGDPKASFTGNTIDHYIDGVPVTKREWDTKIGAIIDEEMFKLLTNPMYFNNLHWQKRRETLLNVCGDVSDGDVIASDKNLSGLPDILGSRTMDEHRKVVASRRKEINDRLKEIPARIDELTKTLAGVQDMARSSIQGRISKLEQELKDMEAGGSDVSLSKRKLELDNELMKIEHDIDKALHVATAEVASQITILQKTLAEHEIALDKADRTRDGYQDIVNKSEQEIGMLRDDWFKVNDQKPSIDSTCPTCGQALPEEEVQAANEKANQKKAFALANINEEGKRMKKRKEDAEKGVEIQSGLIKNLTEELASIKLNLAFLEEKRVAIKAPADLVKKADELKKAIADVSDQILKGDSPIDTTEIRQALQTGRAKLASIDAAEKTADRIEVLKADEKKLAEEFEALEQQMFIMDKFTIAKVSLLDEKINSKFTFAKFKLFESQINEGIKETCITTYNGIPWGAGLNRGSEINIGLDIIRTLSDHFGVTAPCFVDNAEAIVELIEPGGQTIKLFVDGKYNELEVEYD